MEGTGRRFGFLTITYVFAELGDAALSMVQEQVTCRTAASEFLQVAKLSASRWLSPQTWPAPADDLLEKCELEGSACADRWESSRCTADNLLLPPMLRQCAEMSDVLQRWNVSHEEPPEGVLSERLSEIMQAFGHFLRAHQIKAELLALAPIWSDRKGLFAGSLVSELENVFGLMLRSAFLRFAMQTPLIQSHCACRDTPETNSLLFDAFDEIRTGRRTSFGVFQCGTLIYEPDYSNVAHLLDLVTHTSPQRCIPLDVMLRAACACRAAANQEFVPSASYWMRP